MEADTQIALLQSDFMRQNVVISKMELMMEKLGEVSNSVAKMLAVHEEKLHQHQETSDELYTIAKDLHNRITQDHREITTNISNVEKNLKETMKDGLDGIRVAISEETESTHKDHETRIRELERWRWLIIGGSVVAGAFAHNLVAFITK